MTRLVTTWLTAGVMPRDAVRRAEEYGVWAAIVAQVIWFTIAMVAILLVTTRVDLGIEATWWETTKRLAGNLAEFAQGLLASRDLEALRVVVAMAVGYLVFQLGVVLASFGVAAWVVRLDGRLAALKRAFVRLTWFSCAGAVAVALVVSGIALSSQSHNAYWGVFYRHHPFPSWPGQQATAAQQQAYQKAYEDWHALRDLWEREAPWLTAGGGEAIGALTFGAVATGLLVLLPAMLMTPGAAGRYPPHSRWPACCEGCGYTLYDVKRRPDCPECGKPVAESIGPRVRCHGGSTLRGMGLMDETVVGWIRPRRLGRSIAPRDGSVEHWKVLAISMVSAGVTGFLAVPAMMLIERRQWQGPLELLEEARGLLGQLLMGGSIAAILTSGAVLATAVVLPGLAGYGLSGRHKTDLLAASAQVGGRTSGFLALWAGVNWATGVLLFALGSFDLLEPLADWISGGYLDDEALVFFTLLGLNVLGLVVYAWVVHRAITAARHANR